MICLSAKTGIVARTFAAQWACLAFGLAVLFLVLSLPASAGDAVTHVNLDKQGYSIGRYDPVAYFTQGRPVRGKTSLTARHKGAKYAFSTRANRALFVANPRKYAPQFGGFCAYGVAQGSKSDIDPHEWDIVDGRLYFSINAGTRSIWKRNKSSYIRRATKVWKIISELN